MEIKLPQLLPECNEPAQQFCNSCRQIEKGREFRKTILKIRGLEDKIEVDFECPLGKSWVNENGEKIESIEKVDRLKIVCENLKIVEDNNGIRWEQGDFINNVEYYMSKSLGNPNVWINVIKDEVYYYKDGSNTSFPLDVYISLEKDEYDYYLNISLLNNEHDYEKNIFSSHKKYATCGREKFKDGNAIVHFLS